MAILTTRRHYPNIFTLEGKLDVPEVDNTIRNAWLSIYTLQQDVIDQKEFLEGAVARGEIAADNTSGASEIVRRTTIQTIVTAPGMGVTMVNAQSKRLPFINTALQLDGGNDAPEYDPASKALTLRGTVDITGAITGLDTLALGTGSGTTAKTFFFDAGSIHTNRGSIWLGVDPASRTTANYAIGAFGNTQTRINADTNVLFMTDDTIEYASYSSISLEWRFRRHVLFDGQSDIIISTFRGHSTQTNPIILVQNDALDPLFTVDNSGNLDAQGTLDVAGAVTFDTTLAVTGAVTLTVPLAVPQGGTGAATFTDGGIMLGSGTGILTVLGQATDGQLPIGSTGLDPVLAAIIGTANEITVTNGAGTITLSQPTDVTIGGILTVTGNLNHDGSGVGFFGTAPAVQAAAYTRNATIVEDRTLLQSSAATTLNNNNVLAALIADLQSYGLIQ